MDDIIFLFITIIFFWLSFIIIGFFDSLSRSE